MNGPGVEPEWFGSVRAFVDGLRLVKDRAGLSTKELAWRAAAMGYALPDGGRLVPWDLPSEATVFALTRACGYGDELVARWLAVQRRLAAGPPPQRGSAWRRMTYDLSWRQIDTWSTGMRAVMWVLIVAGVAVWAAGCGHDAYMFFTDR